MTLGLVGNNLLNDDIRNSVSFRKDEVLLPGANLRAFANIRWASSNRPGRKSHSHVVRAQQSLRVQDPGFVFSVPATAQHERPAFRRILFGDSG
jgi:hypothetical protein